MLGGISLHAFTVECTDRISDPAALQLHLNLRVRTAATNFKSSPKKRHTNWAQRSPPSPSRPQSLEPSLRVPLVCNARHRFSNDMISWTHPKLSKDHSHGSLKFPEILQLSLLGDHIVHTITQVRARRNARDVWHVGSVVLHSPSTPGSPALSLCVFLCFTSLPPSFPLSPLFFFFLASTSPLPFPSLSISSFSRSPSLRYGSCCRSLHDPTRVAERQPFNWP